MDTPTHEKTILMESDKNIYRITDTYTRNNTKTTTIDIYNKKIEDYIVEDYQLPTLPTETRKPQIHPHKPGTILTKGQHKYLILENTHYTNTQNTNYYGNPVHITHKPLIKGTIIPTLKKLWVEV